MDNKLKGIADLQLYTLTELEPILGVTHRTLLRYMKDGRLRAKKIGAKWRVTRAALEEFLGEAPSNGPQATESEDKSIDTTS